MIWYQYVSVWSPNLSVLLPWNILTGHWGGTLKGHRKADKDLSRAYQEFARIDYSDKEAAWRRWLLNTEIWAGDHKLIQRTVTIRNTDIGRLRGPSKLDKVGIYKGTICRTVDIIGSCVDSQTWRFADMCSVFCLQKLCQAKEEAMDHLFDVPWDTRGMGLSKLQVALETIWKCTKWE